MEWSALPLDKHDYLITNHIHLMLFCSLSSHDSQLHPQHNHLSLSLFHQMIKAHLNYSLLEVFIFSPLASFLMTILTQYALLKYSFYQALVTLLPFQTPLLNWGKALLHTVKGLWIRGSTQNSARHGAIIQILIGILGSPTFKPYSFSKAGLH